ncbi:protein kinase family protein [Kosakonia sp. CCTCC M2018092]|uniref:protein kinase family protein n=1 Tax=Kosakonia sp. CCTCC M2018092 TaxID=2492396 RepID=UPI000F610872|nr:protein kinase family protein [Kosakonia sp. CCTCC M2018092]AZI88019.1 protein kinase family protein [Kosakonia sp. CCTCC M2018092]
MIPHCSYFIDPGKELGEGSFGDVDRVKIRNSKKEDCGDFARKILKNHHGDPLLEARFRREVISQDACLNINVVQIFMCNLISPPLWYVMELGECSLQDEIKAGTLQQDEKIKIAQMIAKGVAHIHKKGFLHRDIKPQNILKCASGMYKISDFGLARHMDPDEASQILTQIGHFPRTPRYFDHNVVLEGYSKQSDIFSIGIVLEELNIAGFDDIITKCTDRRLPKRYLNADQLLNDIHKHMEQNK